MHDVTKINYYIKNTRLKIHLLTSFPSEQYVKRKYQKEFFFDVTKVEIFGPNFKPG
jgi:hypothetical protein